MKIKSTLLAAMVLMSSTYIYQQAMATPSKPTLSDFFEEEIITLDDAVQQVPSQPTVVSSEANDEGYFFRRFWLRLRPRVERDIPGLAGFSIIPEAELLWEKQTPEGWEIYKIEKKKPN